MNLSTKINKNNVEEIIALSSTQEGMLFHYLKSPSSYQYHEQLSLSLSGKLDTGSFKKAWLRVVEDNQTLRTIFAWKNLTKPIQIVLKQAQISFSKNDLTNIYSKEEKENVVYNIKQNDLKDGFDLETGPLFRIILCKLMEEEYELILSYHHIIFDGWSMGVILKEFFTAYTSYCNGQSPRVQKKTPFTQYLRWLNQRDIEPEKKYWQDYLAGLENKTSLPVDSFKHSELSKVSNLDFQFSDNLTVEIQSFIKKEGITSATLFNTCWGILLQKYTNSNDVLFGTIVSGRPSELSGIEEMVGLFVNTVPVRFNHLREREVIRDVLKKVNIDSIQNKRYEHFALAEMKNLSELSTDDTLFDSILVVENYPLEEVIQKINKNSHLKITDYSVFEMTNYHLTIVVSTFHGFSISFIYNIDLFKEETIRRLGNYFMNILGEIVKKPGKKISQLEILSEDEKKLLLIDFNDTERGFSYSKSIHQLFEEKVEAIPDEPALIAGRKKITYSQLNEKVNHLARVLALHGAGKEDITAIMVEPSCEMVTGILAILKTGGTYLPISPNLPVDRINYMLKDSGARIILTQNQCSKKIPPFIQNILLNQQNTFKGGSDNTNMENCIENFSEEFSLDFSENTTDCFGGQSKKSSPKDIAYIIYTSGSTGKPKGVLVEHGSLLNTLVGLQEEYPILPGDTWLLKTTFMFDVSLTEIFGWILGGGSLAILEAGGEKDPKRILEAIAEYEVTHINFVPSMFNLFMDYVETVGEKAVQVINRLKYIMVAGEAISYEQVKRFYRLTKEVEFVNLYGPTEAAIYATQFRLKDADKYQKVPIGKGVANARLYILDKDDNLQPIGFPGELCIGGKGVARGYLNRPELTAEKFTDNPFISGERIYRTGDLVCWLPDGNIEFLGRLDHQVKVRGYRIELGEIEAVLLSHPLVKEAVVILSGDYNEKYLIAYYVSEDDIELADFHSYLEEKLPEYMIPSYFMKIDQMPLTQSGKLNRRALPEFAGEIKSDHEYIAPVNELEVKLISIWSELLGIDNIGVNNNFFKLGGHSLKATRLVARILKDLHIEIPLKVVFENPTVKGLAQYIKKAEQKKYYQIKKNAEGEHYPVSSAQKRLFLLEELNDLDITYNMFTLIKVETEDLGENESVIKKLEDIFSKLITRHESLRTSFEIINGEVVQKIHSKVNFKIDYFAKDMELSDTESFGVDKVVDDLVYNYIRPFNLRKAPLIRVGLVMVSNDVHYLIVDMHHIISDGVSTELLIDEFVKLYQGKDLPEINVQYKDYSIWQHEFLKTDKLQTQEKYWLKIFDNKIPVLDLPYDYSRPTKMRFTGDNLAFKLDEKLTCNLNKLAAEQNVTLYMVLLASFTILLARYSGQEDIIVGSPIAGRDHPDLEKTVGMFVNTLAIRNYPESEKSFMQYLNEVKENTLTAYQNQDYPFDMLVEKLSLNKDKSRNPLFDVMLVLQNMDRAPIKIEGLKLTPCTLKTRTAKFDLNLEIVEKDKEMYCNLDYCTELFRRETIKKMSKHFVNVLQEVIENPNIQISEIQMISKEEKIQLLYGFNNTKTNYPADKTINQLFSEQVQKRPDQTAVVFEDRKLTYAELDLKTDQLAGLLRENGVKSNQIVGLMVECSLEMIIGILGIIKAGGAYLPILIDYPEKRIEYMLKDSQVKVLLTKASHKSRISFSGKVIDLEDENIYLGEYNRPEDLNIPDDLAYTIYTSGSTGKPKGVLIEHNSVINLIHGLKQEIYDRYQSPLNVVLLAPYVFDASVQQIFAALLLGHSLFICPEDVRRDGERLVDYYNKNLIDISDGTPTHLSLLTELPSIQDKALRVKHFIIGGEILYSKLIQKFMKKFGSKIIITNIYGPAECCVDSTAYHINDNFINNKEINENDINHNLINDKADWLKRLESVPIGSPLSNVSIYILDENLNPVPIGVTGEICIAGAGLARGYLNLPELTAEKFVSNPFTEGKMYRTGDLGKWLDDGTIQFIGRKDNQLKIRGYRIEIGEIEAQLLSHEKVKEAAVLVDGGDKEKYLSAYYVADGDILEELRDYLKKELPEYMIPTYFLQIDKMPLTTNGKIDRKALAKLQGKIKSTVEYQPPSSEIEAKLVELWSEILGVDPIGINDNFFTLGGHSLKATTFVAKAFEELNIEIPLRQVFETPTIKEIAKFVESTRESIYSAIEPVEKQEYYPVSSAQKRLYILHQIKEFSTSYNISGAIIIEGKLDVDSLDSAFKKLIRRHESLRTSFEMVDGMTVQRIRPDVDFKLRYMVQDPDQDMEKLIKDFIKPFDLSQSPLLRVGLVELSDSRDKYLLLFDMHHIISDGTSMDILIREMSDLYQGKELDELRIQYKDFAIWQNQLFASEKLKKQEEYWLDLFSDEIPVIEIPTDYPRPVVTGSDGDCVSRVVDKNITEQIIKLAQKTRGTVFMILLAAYNILLSRYSGQEDIIIGSPIAGRPHVDLQNIIGVFINTLAFRNYPRSEKTFVEFLGDVKERALQAYENQDYQFDMLVEKLELKRDLSRNPLFDVMFVLQNIAKDQRIRIDDLEFKSYNLKKTMVKFDLNLHAIEVKDEIHLDLHYSTDLFQEETVKRMLTHFIKILKEVVENPEIRLKEIEMVSSVEKSQLLFEFNQTDTDFPGKKTVVEMFEEQTSRAPERIALIQNNETLTYQELNQKANQLARILREKGIGPDTIVGLIIEPSFEMFIGILGIQKAGGAYLPIDPDFPWERIDYMLKDSGTKIVLTSTEIQGRIWQQDEMSDSTNQDFNIGAKDNPERTISSYEILDLMDNSLYVGDKNDLPGISTRNNLVYLIYTSGTTGQPKGVQLENRGLINYIQWFTRQVGITEDDKSILLSSFCFDLSYTAIYPLLTKGGVLHLISKETYSDPVKLLDYLESNEVTYFKTTPSHFSMIVNAFEFSYGNQFDSLRLVVLGGEEINPVDISKFFNKYPGTTFMNHYGPTEATIGCIFKVIDNSSLESFKSRPVIGKPIDNMKVHILDKNLKLIPVGVIGEIHISGPGLARGYLNKPELTGEKFILSPLSDDQVLYKTGDLGRYLPDGSIEFRGRKDNQVKIRGFRIEIGEIEKTLASHDSISEVVIMVRKSESGEKYLVAYFVANETLTVSELRTFMLQKIPSYMVPAYFVQLETMPLTLNGKIDRSALPEVDGNIGIQVEFIPPEDEMEEKIVEIWQRVLNVQKIGVNYNFFDLGGNSLNATNIISLLHQELNVALPLGEFFKKPTVRELADYLRRAEECNFEEIPVIEEREYYPVSSAQKRLFILEQMEFIGTTYNTPVVMGVEGNLDIERLERAFRKLIQRHDSLRTSFTIVNGEMVQKIHKDVDFKINRLESAEKEIESIVWSLIKPFDLGKAPLLRVSVVRLLSSQAKMKKNILVLDMHHIISDIVSKNILVKEVISLYRGNNLEKLRIQYKDFAVWQKKLFESDNFKKQEEYWLNQFDNEIPVLNMPTDYPKPAVKNFAGARIVITLEKELTDKIKDLANGTGATLYMVLLANFNILLAKYSHQKDIIIGSPIAGRRHSDLENIIGVFINTLAMRNYPGDEKSYREFLSEVKERALKAFENQDYQLEMLLDRLDLKKNMNTNSLFDVMFDMKSVDYTPMVVEDLKFTVHNLEHKTSKFDLLLSATENSGQIYCTFEYSTQLYTRDTISRLGKHFISITRKVIQNLDIRLSDIEMITQEEKQQILSQFNDTRVDYPVDKTIHQLFEQQVLKNPDKFAMVAEDKKLTYKELNARSNQLARVIRNRGIQPDEAVAIIIERLPEMIIGVLAIIKAGGAYLPIEVDYPEQRVNFMLTDANVRLILTNGEMDNEKGLFESDKAREIINITDDRIYEGDTTNLENMNSSEDLIYIIYTSGSTGKSKGVMVKHKNVNRLISNSNMLKISENERIMPTGPLAFDASTFEVWGTLLNGATMYLIPKEKLLSVRDVEKFMLNHEITMIWLTSPLFNYLFDENPEIFSKLKTLIVGGDALSVRHINGIRERYPDLTVINGYGPTENTTFTTYYVIKERYEENIPIGYPVSNTQVYILDKYNNMQPIGVPGELCITGDGLARGYLNRAELTREKFVENPFMVGEKMYRTGDLARWLADGRIEFLGRIDHQVKIRGFRIEPGEIEAQLQKIELIKKAVVIPHKDKADNKFLVAYFVADKKLEAAAIREDLRGELPDYMIPSYFIQLKEMPLTPNGKIDRKALPVPDQSIITDNGYQPPTNEIEAKLAEIFAQILGVEKVGIDADFFELGGHSLKATAFVSTVFKELNVEIPLKQVFETPTIRELAQFVSKTEKSIYTVIEPIEEREYYPLSSAQRRLFIMEQMRDISTTYNMPDAKIIEGNLDVERLEKAFKEFIQRHESLRTSFEMVDGEPVQKIYQEVDFAIDYQEINSKESDIEEIIKGFVKPFKLNEPPLLRVGVIKLGNNGDSNSRYLLIFDMHHIISDGVSMAIMVKEVIDLYLYKKLPELRIQYKDFTIWHNNFLNSDKIKQQEKYWLNKFKGDIPVLNLPTDYERPSKQSFEGDRIYFKIDERLTQKLKDFVYKTETTLYITLLAVYNVLLFKYSGQEDIIVGSPITGRTYPELENIMGMFVNMLCMRNHPEKDKTFIEFLKEVKGNALDAYQNQDYQYEDLVKSLGIKRDTNRNPIFTVVFAMQNLDTKAIETDEMKITHYQRNSNIAKFDLLLDAVESENIIKMYLDYKVKLFKRTTAQEIIEDYLDILEQLLANPDLKLKDVKVSHKYLSLDSKELVEQSQFNF